MNSLDMLRDTLLDYLKSKKVKKLPTTSDLDSLFGTAFYASLETEEGMPLVFDLIYIDPSNPDPTPPPLIRDPRWKYVPFISPIELNKRTLAKIALSTDKRTSMFAVYPDKKTKKMMIWGFIDQGTNTYLYETLEGDGGWAPPGLFHVSVIAPGHILISDDMDKVAELHGPEIQEKPVRAFYKSTVSKSLEPISKNLHMLSRRYHEQYNFHEDDEINEYFSNGVYHQIISGIRRMLIRTKNYGHGGAYLITDTITASELNIKYPLDYTRLSDSIQKNAILSEVVWQRREELNFQMDERKRYIDKDLYLNAAISEDEQNDTKEELTGCLWFCSLLSRIDGLVLFDQTLVVKGFGVEILTEEVPTQIWLAGDANDTRAKRKPLDYDHFGTRHRSMMRYIYKNPTAIGMVVSQDGGVKIMLNRKNEIVIWDNIQLTLH